MSGSNARARDQLNESSTHCTDSRSSAAIHSVGVGYNLRRKWQFSASRLAVAQWIVHMPPKRGIQVRFLSAGPFPSEFGYIRNILLHFFGSHSPADGVYWRIDFNSGDTQ